MIKTINIKTKRILFILLTTISFSIYAQNEISVKIINGDILDTCFFPDASKHWS